MSNVVAVSYSSIMVPLIKEKSREISELCRDFGVESLDVFGSASAETFRNESSDIDFIARFTDRSPGTYLDRYLDFASALERLFGRPVDLMTENAIRNPYFRRAVEATRQNVYEQGNTVGLLNASSRR